MKGLIRVGVPSALGCTWGLGRIKAMRHRCGEGWQPSFGNRRRGEGLLGVTPPAEESCKRAACLAGVVWEVGILQGAELLWGLSWRDVSHQLHGSTRGQTDQVVKSPYFSNSVFWKGDGEGDVCKLDEGTGISPDLAVTCFCWSYYCPGEDTS